MKIGVFDSGVGGITVLTALQAKFPEARFVYVGDTLHVPYGTRSQAQIRVLAAAAVARFRPKGIDALVVACNTASSLALDEIKASVGASVPVFGVVEAGVTATLAAWHRAAARSRGGGRIVVLATRATVKSGIYSRLLRERLGDGLPVAEQACPLLVPMIEEGWIDHPVLHQTIEEYVRAHAPEQGGVAHLACTHYPWIQEAFQKALPGWEVVNSAAAVADLVADAVGRAQRCAASPAASSQRQASQLGAPAAGDSVDWIFTDPDVVPRFAVERFGIGKAVSE